MPAWPPTLPAPALSTLVEAPPKNTIRTSMDKGPDKVRRRTTANTRPISFTLKLLKADVQTLDDFFVTATFSGAVQFDYIHPRTLLACQARFTQEPQYAEQEGALYNATIALEIMP